MLALSSVTLVALLLGALVLNNDKALKHTANFLLDLYTPEAGLINVDTVSGSDLNLFSFGFEKLKLSYNGVQVIIYDLSLYSALTNKKYEVNHLSIDSLTVVLASNKKESKNKLKNNSDITSIDSDKDYLTEYMPSAIFDNWLELNVAISNISIETLKAKKENIILVQLKKTTLQKTDEELRFKSNLIDIDLNMPIKLSFTASKLGFYDFSLGIDQSNFLSAKIDFSKAESTLNKNYSISGNINVKTDIEFNISMVTINYLNKYLAKTNIPINTKITDYLKSIEKIDSSAILTSTHSFTADKLESLILKTKTDYFNAAANSLTDLNIFINSDMILDDLPINKISIQSNLLKDDDNNDSGNKSITFLQQAKVKIKLNQQHKDIKNNIFLKKLSNEELILSIPENSLLEIKNNQLFINSFYIYQNIFKSKKVNKLTLNNITVYLSADNMITASLNYNSNINFNNRLNFSPKGTISFKQEKDKYLLDLSGKETNLGFNFNIKTRLVGNGIFSNFSFQLSKIQRQKKNINKYITAWNEDLNLNRGSIYIKGEAESKKDNIMPNMQYQFNVQINDIGLTYDDYELKEINYSHDLEGNINKLYSKSITPLLIDNITNGISLNNISLIPNITYYFNDDSYVIFSNFQGELLGGHLSSDDFTMEINKTTKNEPLIYRTETRFTLKDLQLKEILQLGGSDEIDGEGLLYGELPIYLDQNDFLITKAWLKNKGEGTLQYKPNPESIKSLDAKPQMSLLLDVLGHLDYHVLQSKINLDKSGTLILENNLEGKNPGYKKGYPIAFNPTLEFNLDEMLRSLSISEDIGKSLKNRLDKQYK